jgi:hypothetical protein
MIDFGSCNNDTNLCTGADFSSPSPCERIPGDCGSDHTSISCSTIDADPWPTSAASGSDNQHSSTDEAMEDHNDQDDNDYKPSMILKET